MIYRKTSSGIVPYSDDSGTISVTDDAGEHVVERVFVKRGIDSFVQVWPSLVFPPKTSVSEPTDDGAVITVTPSPIERSYTSRYRKSGDSNWTTGPTATGGTGGKTASLPLSGLDPSTEYEWEVSSYDDDGNLIATSSGTFKTKEEPIPPMPISVTGTLSLSGSGTARNTSRRIDYTPQLQISVSSSSVRTSTTVYACKCDTWDTPQWTQTATSYSGGSWSGSGTVRSASGSSFGDYWSSPEGLTKVGIYANDTNNITYPLGLGSVNGTGFGSTALSISGTTQFDLSRAAWFLTTGNWPKPTISVTATIQGTMDVLFTPRKRINVDCVVNISTSRGTVKSNIPVRIAKYTDMSANALFSGVVGATINDYREWPAVGYQDPGNDTLPDISIGDFLLLKSVTNPHLTGSSSRDEQNNSHITFSGSIDLTYVAPYFVDGIDDFRDPDIVVS